MQRDLFDPGGLQVQPRDGLAGPRLWFRRFAIWPEPGAPPLQDRIFAPGLNIIWSPDPVDGGTSDGAEHAPGPGHGAGKTLVCRLLRYCMGETHFAPAELRSMINSAFNSGRVGVEVMVDGRAWAVVRSIGVLAHDVVVENGTLEEAASPDATTTGIAPFVDMLADRFVTPSVAGLIADSPRRAWLLALAWLSRDQECHFGKVTEWRVAGGHSGSPAHGLSVSDATNIVRALIGAITPRERELEAKIEALNEERRVEDHGVERGTWLIEKTRSRLLRELDVGDQAHPPGELLVPFLRSAARERIAKVAVVDAKGHVASVPDLETLADAAQEKIERLTNEMASADFKASSATATSTLIEREVPGLSASLDDAEVPMCQVCEVPIDRALAEGCRLSHKLPDLASLRDRRERLAEDLRKCRADKQAAEDALARLRPELEAASVNRERIRSELKAARRLRDDRAEVWYAARRVTDDIDNLEQLLKERAGARTKVERLDQRITQLRDDVSAERQQHAQVFSELGNHFDPLVRRLLGAAATGQVKHDGHGLHLVVNMGTACNSPALDLVKVLAFDLATLCRSIEGATSLPALLIHDSPRSSDLGLSIYHALFHLMLELEGAGAQPQFQYIVTTTSRPPDDLVDDERVRMKLQGSPAAARLLGRDL